MLLCVVASLLVATVYSSILVHGTFQVNPLDGTCEITVYEASELSRYRTYHLAHSSFGLEPKRVSLIHPYPAANTQPEVQIEVEDEGRDVAVPESQRLHLILDIEDFRAYLETYKTTRRALAPVGSQIEEVFPTDLSMLISEFTGDLHYETVMSDYVKSKGVCDLYIAKKRLLAQIFMTIAGGIFLNNYRESGYLSMGLSDMDRYVWITNLANFFNLYCMCVMYYMPK